MQLRDLVARAVAMGATLGLPASTAELAAAEARLGIRFDAQYRELMSICSGIEGLEAFLYSVEELGASPRWLASTAQLEIEYFQYEPTFETHNGETIEPIFNPAPAGRAHVLIGETELVSSCLVCNFSVSDPGAPSGDIADCRYEPDILGDLAATLTRLLDRHEDLRSDDSIDLAQHDRADVRFQTGRLIGGIATQNRAIIRHALSGRWRAEFDRRPGQSGLNMLRKAVLWGGAAQPTLESLECDLWGDAPPTVRAIVNAPSGWVETRREVVIGVVKENTVWRIDSWTWSGIT
ncbi:SMI1/KNR4 family protein [Nocardia sp. NPDC059240]|uniref:SMI1/KNR4 family protein n=1 Tax=Nocardia sp. NPDC059240 TaxID=3346786 RepID=UPI003699F54E